MSDSAATNTKIEPVLMPQQEANGLRRTAIWAALPIIAIVMVGIAGHAASSLKPLIIQAFVHYIGFDKATSGFMLSTELLATSGGTVLATAFPFALRRRGYLFFALAVMMAANLVSISFKTHPGMELYVLRALSGLGAGFALGRLGILIALSGRPGKTAALYSTSTQIYGAAAAFAMPFLNQIYGSNTIFYVLAGTVPLALFLIGFLPESNERVAKKNTVSSGDLQSIGVGEKAILAVAFFVFYLGVGTFFPFISVLGETSAISQSQMSSLLGWGAERERSELSLLLFARYWASTYRLLRTRLCGLAGSGRSPVLIP